ncbi:YgaP-like transmembrane domain [Tranquillimonas rosea]|uniref:YgaP-like transmembrane domain n=1 Tax=Tranquillimonas rosea TaxID=641238 RepID=UPI003BABA684
MTVNMGKVDRGVRVLVAVVLVALAFAVPALLAGWLHWLLLVVAAVLLVTSLLGNCPAYSVLGIRTCRTRV